VVALNTLSGAVFVKAATTDKTTTDDLQKGLVLNYDFNEITTDKVKDVSGNNNDGSFGGTAKITDGGKVSNTLNLDGKGYVKLPNGILDKLNDITISTWVKFNSSDNANWQRIFDFGMDTKNYFFLSKNRVCNLDVKGTVEGPGSKDLIPDNKWVNIAVTLADGKMIYYEDGVEFARAEGVKDKPSDLLGATENYIGKSKFSADPNLTGKIDEFRIYNRALSKDEVYNLMMTSISDKEVVENAKNSLDLGDLSEITNNLNLPSSGTNGVSINYSSSNEKLLSSKGVVTRPDVDKTAQVTLTATLTKGSVSDNKVFNVTILPKSMSNYSLNVDANKSKFDISNDLIGLFFEDINHGADGGLYAELVENNSFEFSNALESWALEKKGTSDGAATVRADNPLNANNKHYLEFSSTSAGDGYRAVNDGYKGITIKKDNKYDFSVWAKNVSNSSGDLKVQLEADDGTIISDTITINGFSDKWTKYEKTLTVKSDSSKAKLVVYKKDKGTVDLDMISLFPEDTWKGRKYGLRKDLVQMLADIKPKFLRFPGGCIVEGDSKENMYNWKDTIGNIEERKVNRDLWGYYQSYGLGFYEYFQLCEDLGASPLPVVNVGMTCQARGDANNTTYRVPLGDELNKYIQDALDLIEYANGDASTTWGAKRAASGHPKPFNLKYLAVGNEQWGTEYYKRFEAFQTAIKAKYPDITLITTSGPSPSGSDFNNAWNWVKQKVNDGIVDEHYYMDPQWFLENTHRYDSYDRNGAKVFVGEYASKSNNLRSALSEAAYLTGLEKNSDVVKMASYAPLFGKVDDYQWSPNMIWFNGTEAYGTPDYYVQKLFSNNLGTQLLQSSMDRYSKLSSDIAGGIILGSWNTGVEYDNVSVTSNKDNSTIFSDDFSTTKPEWQKNKGNWTVKDGKLVLTDLLEDARTYINNDQWSNYTLSLKAKKTSGNEGFLIGVGAKDTNNFYWLNVGGWTNTRTVIEKATNGTKSVVSEADASHSGNVVTGKEYDIKIVVNGSKIDCYIDGVLTNSYSQQQQEKDVYTSSSYDKNANEVILKVVNTTTNPKEVKINLNGVDKVASEATEEYITSGSQLDENSFADKTKVSSVKNKLTGISKNFGYNARPNSVAVLRIKVDQAASEDTLKNGLKLYYTFDGSKDNVVTDLSGNNNAGTLEGSAKISDDSKFGKGLSLDGNGDVKLPNNLLDDLKDITVSSWVKYSSASADWERLFDFGKDTNNFFFLSKNKHIGINVNSSPQDLQPAGAQVNDKWIHVAVTLVNNTLIYYENGVEVARQANVTNKPSDIKSSLANYIGKSKFNDPLLHGNLDEFRIYNRALSSDEISLLSKLVPQRTVEVTSSSKDNKVNQISGTLQMSAVVRPTDEAVTWSVQGLDGKDTDLASIDSNGLLTSKKAGSVNVIATLKNDPTVYGMTKVTIVQKVDSLTLSGTDGKGSINTKGGTLQIKAAALPDNATDKTVSWSLTDDKGKATNVATIDDNGLLKARKNGTVIVLATAKDTFGAVGKLTVQITNQDEVDNKKLADICPKAPAEQLLYDVDNINNESAWGANNTHDPSIYKDGEWYYVFSTDYKVGGATGVGLQVRKSKDLITWQWVGRAFSDIPASAKAWAPKATNMWAPDVTKVGDTYYLYYTVSEFGTNNSFIGVATSKSIEGPWTDQGEVYKTKSGVNTDNALDPNITKDANGDLWLVYGSYFGGIYISKVDKTTGKLATPGQGKQIAATGKRKNMEAPYVIYNPQFKKYYLFMSYDDLASDYNVRVAWADKIDGPYTDLNGKSVMDTPTDTNSLYNIGTKVIGSYAFGNDPGWIAPGHNSVLNDNGNFYFVSHARGGVDKNWAYLQVRKIAWSEDGKPAISPERYAGEKEQKIDKSLIAGKYQAIVMDRLNNNKLTSNDVTLYPDGKINDENGKNYWELTGDNILKLHYYDPGKTAGDYWVDTVKVLPSWDFENWRPTLVYTGYNQDNTEIWGKQLEAIDTKVTEIKVTSKNNKAEITEKGGKLEFTASVVPDYATDSTVSWKVTDANGNQTDIATISDDGVLTAVKDGTVRVVAIANDGSEVTGNLDIKISGQSNSGNDNGSGTNPGGNNTNPGGNGNSGNNNNGSGNNGTTTGNDNNSNNGGDKVVIGVVSNGVLPVEIKAIDNKNGENIISLDSKSIENKTEITISDIGSLRAGTGSFTINLGGYESIKLPFSLIDKALLKDGTKVIIRTYIDSASDLVKNLKGIKKVFGYEIEVINNGTSTFVHSFASGVAEININLSDEELKGLDKNNISVFYYNEDTKKFEVMDTVVSGNKVTFKTPHFSKFIIAEKDKDAATTTSTTTIPKTGSLVGSNLLLFSGLLLIILGAATVFTKRRRTVNTK
jgi:alpha-L-arabinofuranosidase/beta-xylosidase